MLIWINGAFGVGKTQTAHELARRLDAAHVADPELLGFAIHKTLPPGMRGDFQDRPQWRSAVAETLIQAEHEVDCPVIVPMTLVDEGYFDDVVGHLRRQGVDVRHYALTASVDVIHQRLRSRVGSVVGRALGREETWAMRQSARCAAALTDSRFDIHVATDDRDIDDVVEEIADRAGLDLALPRMGRHRSWFRREAVAIRHIRL